MDGLAVAQETPDGADHQTGSSGAVPFTGELGEVPEPHGCVVERGDQVLGLVDGAVWAAGPAPMAHAFALFSAEGTAHRARSGRQRRGAPPRA